MKLDGYTVDETTLLVWADAYERRGFSLVTDALFDGLAYEAANKRKTSRFTPYTGQWVADHRTPELMALTDACIELALKQGHDPALVWPKDLHQEEYLREQKGKQQKRQPRKPPVAKQARAKKGTGRVPRKLRAGPSMAERAQEAAARARAARGGEA